jgi:hypothetical protein
MTKHTNLPTIVRTTCDPDGRQHIQVAWRNVPKPADRQEAQALVQEALVATGWTLQLRPAGPWEEDEVGVSRTFTAEWMPPETG